MKGKKSSVSNSDAIFCGWQKTLSGDNIALYNITAANHPFQGSTVSEKTLNKLNLKMPKRKRSKTMEIVLRILGKERKKDLGDNEVT
jgi:hypothetical protein